ncbi:hypothetical protein EDB83DRAFT_930447 [Lactarius deliciosus]|nr:hypothetical protein EDB83DRAFT_930447 [Lactarius deliciosus]
MFKWPLALVIFLGLSTQLARSSITFTVPSCFATAKTGLVLCTVPEYKWFKIKIKIQVSIAVFITSLSSSYTSYYADRVSTSRTFPGLTVMTACDRTYSGLVTLATLRVGVFLKVFLFPSFARILHAASSVLALHSDINILLCSEFSITGPQQRRSQNHISVPPARRQKALWARVQAEFSSAPTAFPFTRNPPHLLGGFGS